MMRRIPKWLVIVAVIVLACVGVKLWYDNLCSGDIDISGSAPSKEMLLHIIKHVDELAAREDLFTLFDYNDGAKTLWYGDNYICFTEDAEAYLSNPSAKLSISGRYWRQSHVSSSLYFYAPDSWISPSTPLHVQFSIADEQFNTLVLYVRAEDVSEVSDAPLREMMDAIVSVIGTP